MVNLLLTNSYFELFPSLISLLKKSGKRLENKSMVFCEAKSSLMIERYICAEMGGSFNAEVSSFSKFLRENKQFDNVLTKEGSAMLIKRILATLQLKCFKQSKLNLSPTLFELITQLKSAKVSAKDILNASDKVVGMLKNKLEDVYSVYAEYENFLKQNGLEDQNSLLSYLPQVIDESAEIKDCDVYIVGFESFTAQIRSAILSLMKNARSVTAILLEGENNYAFVNETANFIRSASKEQGQVINEIKIESNYQDEAKIISSTLFNPNENLIKSLKQKNNNQKLPTDKLYFYPAKNPADEILRVGEVIRKLVNEGKCRYKDVTIATADFSIYKDDIKRVFDSLEIPYFLDEQQVPLSHPLITLILSYVDIFRKGFDREDIISFVKNPLFIDDKNLTDLFENYLVKYNVNYKRIFTPFTFPCQDEIELKLLENLRLKVTCLISKFNLEDMLESLSVSTKLESLANKLREQNQSEQASITEQIYQSVINLLTQMKMLLGDVELSYAETKQVFLSGVSALKMSVIPQYNDAVFIGAFKETALAKAKYLFVIGLTNDVPTVQLDVALLSDEDLNVLEQIKVLVEPKIRVVNHRTRESVTMALSAFERGMFMSYPMASIDGKKKEKSQIVTFLNGIFQLNEFPKKDGYLTYSEGLYTFSKACGEFASGVRIDDCDYDFTIPSSFYCATDSKKLQPILDSANKQVKKRLSGEKVSLIKNVTSPTAIEEYYKCPFKAFVSHALKVKERDEGNVNVLSVGNLMHEILKDYVKLMHTVTDKYTSDKLFDKISTEVLSRDEYKKFLSEKATSATVNRVLNECRQYCYKTWKSIKNSAFDNFKTEVGFGEGKYYPPISLLDGKVKLKGKIDRVDESKEYFRILDYKTGKADSSEKSLFAGVKLQLYLYAKAVMDKYNNGDQKLPAGLYYLPVSNKFENVDDKTSVLATGKTLGEQCAITEQDKTFFESGKSNFADISLDEKTGKIKNAIDKDTLLKYIDYAVKISEKAVERLSQGVILASPYENVCEYCQFSALCGVHNAQPRSVGGVKDAFDLNDGGDDNAKVN